MAGLVIEAEVMQLPGSEPFPADAAGTGRLPRFGGMGRILAVRFEDEFSTAAEGFSQRPFPALGKSLDRRKQFLGDLNLRFYHAVYYMATSI